jgi:MFS family permease
LVTRCTAAPLRPKTIRHFTCHAAAQRKHELPLAMPMHRQRTLVLVLHDIHARNLQRRFFCLLHLPIVRKMKDQRLAAFIASIISAIGSLGLLLAPSVAMLWIILVRIGACTALILGLAFVMLASKNSHQAAALSGMSQCVGYLFTAAGPPLVGRFHDASGNWGLALATCAVLWLVMALPGLFAGRAVHIWSTRNGRATAKAIQRKRKKRHR